jgi:hypothetical protein
VKLLDLLLGDDHARAAKDRAARQSRRAADRRRFD